MKPSAMATTRRCGDRINRVIDETVEERIRDAIEHPPLAEETIAFADVDRIRLEMQEAATRRLQPHYIRAFFEAALTQLMGSMKECEPGRFQIVNVPASIRQRDRQIGSRAPVLAKYERVTFDKSLVRQIGAPPAELLAPGHPLLEAVIDLILERHRGLFKQGAVLIDEADTGTQPRVLVMLEHAIADARPTRSNPHTVVSRRFEFIEIDEQGRRSAPGMRPTSDYRPASDDETSHVSAILESEWLTTNLEELGRSHAIQVAVPDHLARVRLHTEHRGRRDAGRGQGTADT